jgi:hypothetical protein
VAKTTHKSVQARFVTVLLTGVWSTRRALFAFCTERVGVDGGADEETSDGKVEEVTKGACSTGALLLHRVGSFDFTALGPEDEN